MKICTEHWEALRAAISKRGLDHLIAPDTKAAQAMVERSVQGTEGPLDFDPLMSANFQLWQLALDFCGLRMMAGEEICPACELHALDWVDGAAHQSFLYAQRNGLLLTQPDGQVPS